MDPKISVILPVYNVEKDLPRCLDALAEQSFPAEKWELIAVDDGSTDDSLGIVQDNIRRFSKINIISQSNKGLGAARNRGLEASKGELVVFCDSDDIPAPDYLKNLVMVMDESNADMAIADARINRDGTLYDYLDNRLWRYLAQKDTYATSLGLHPKALLFQPSVWRRVYRRDFLINNKLGFPEGLVFEDIPFHFKTLRKAIWIAFLPEPVYYYNDSRTESITNEKSARFRDLFTVFDQVHTIAHDDYESRWLLYFYSFEFRTLKRVHQEIVPELKKDFRKRMRKSLAFYPLSVRIQGWFFRLKQKLLDRV